MTWLVTGATGLLGANAGLLLPDAIGTSRTGAVGPGYRAGIAADLREPTSLHEAVREAKPSVVIHAAAMATHEACEADPVLARRANAEATGHLAEAAAEAGAAFVYVSTDAVFDGARGNYNEDDEPNPFSVYGETKLAGEHEALQRHPDPLVVRVNFFGWSPSGTRSILEFFVNELGAGHRVRGYVDFTVTSLYVAHLVQAIDGLVAARANGLVHIASSDALSKAYFGAEVAHAFGLDTALIERISAADSGRSIARTRDLSLDTAKAAGLLGNAMPTQASGIERARQDEALRQRLRGS